MRQYANGWPKDLHRAELRFNMAFFVPQAVLALWGSGAFEACGSTVANPRLGVDEQNEFRISIIDIDVFEPARNRHGKVAHTRALEPQQHFPAQCL